MASLFFKTLLFVGIGMAILPLHAEEMAIVFKSKADLEHALEPLNLSEVVDRISASTTSLKIDFRFDEGMTPSKTASLRHLPICHLLKFELYRTKEFSVYYPEAPRVPHHLIIAYNRREIKGISDVTKEENECLFKLIKKIEEIYRSINIQGFVIAEFDTPQEGHSRRSVVEIIPHLPGFNGIKNLVDKIDCNRYLLFRSANLSPLKCQISNEEVKNHVTFWQEAFTTDLPPLSERGNPIRFPTWRQESHHLKAEKILCGHLLELLQDKGGQTSHFSPIETHIPATLPETVKSVKIEKCAFCDPSVIERQFVYEHEDTIVFYNMRKGAKPASSFLLLPKRHTEKVSGLESTEIQNLYVVRKALVEVLKESHPECEVIVYTQDDPCVGQTVFHTHEQIVAIDPETIALTWTLQSLYPSGSVSDEEMASVCKTFALKLDQKIKEQTDLKEAI